MSETQHPVLPALPTAAQVPVELLPLRRWCGWVARWDEIKQKWKKPPCSPLTGKHVGPVAKNAEHFLTFEEALKGVRQHSLDGVGFMLVGADGLVGVDFDDCRQDGVITPAVADWLRWFPSYAEISPSGTGVHVIGRGRLKKALSAKPLPETQSTTVEAYGWERYFTFTGQNLGQTLLVGDIQVGLDKLLAHLGSKPEARGPDDEPQQPLSRLTIKRLHTQNLESLRQARQGEGNATLNTTAFFAARAFSAGCLDGTEEGLKKELLGIVTKEWKQPHPETGARETIASGWTSGLTQPLLVRDDEWPQVIQTIEEFNKKYYVIENYGGRCRVGWEEPSRIARGESFLLVTQSFVDFHNRFMHQLIQVGEDAKGNPQYQDKATCWLKNRNRAQFDKVVFEPGKKTPTTIRNLWRGFAYEPVKGDCELYLAHLRDNICNGERFKYDYLLGWMAYAVRHPAEQGHVAIVVQGEKGVGKNVFAETFADLWGQHGIIISDQTRVTRNFNAHLRDKCVLVADEAFFAGDRRHEGVLKALITGSTMTIEAKGVDAVTVPNLLHVIIIGNDPWLVPASAEERRYLVVRCGGAQQQRHRYFQAIRDQMRAGGYAALLHRLLFEVDLSSFNVRQAPHTEELRRQMMDSLRGAEAAFADCLYTGVIPGRVEKDGTVRLRTADFVEWARKKERGWSNVKPHHVGRLFAERLCFMGDKELAKNERSRYWVIPPLATSRRLWDEKFYKTKWPHDGGEWDTISTEEVGF